MQFISYFCTLTGCDRKHHAKGYCWMHYNRLKRGVALDAPIRGEEAPADRFWRQVVKLGESPTKFCWEWQGATSKGYGVIRIERILIKAHQYSFFLKHSRYAQDGLIIRHTCDNPICVNPKHLLEGTQQDNTNDRIERGRTVLVTGEDVVTSKLTEKDVKRIRKLFDKGIKIPTIHLEYEFVDIETVRSVAKRNSWKHVKEPRKRIKKLQNLN